MPPKTYSDVLQQIHKLQTAANRLRKKEVAGVVKRIRKAIVLYNITAKELYPAATEKVAKAAKATKVPPAPPKQRGPRRPAHTPPRKPTRKQAQARKALVGRKKPIQFSDGAGNTWSGGGSTPRWLRELIDQGRNKEEFRINAEVSK